MLGFKNLYNLIVKFRVKPYSKNLFKENNEKVFISLLLFLYLYLLIWDWGLF